MNLMSNNNNYPMAPDEEVRHSSKRVSELRSALANAQGMIQAQQARIAELECELAMYRKTRTAEVLTPAGEQKSCPRYQP